MKYRIEGNALIIKGLFSEKRYDFQELTKVSFADGICIYMDDKCILKETDYNKKAIYAMDLFHLAIRNNLIFEDKGWFIDEISLDEVYDYSISVQEKIKDEFCEYVKQELGEDYELIISTDETPYHVRVFMDIYHEGEKLYIKEEPKNVWWTDWLDGKMDIHLCLFELVMPTYVDVRKQEFRLTKLVDLKDSMQEIKDQIRLMKENGMVTVSSLLKK